MPAKKARKRGAKPKPPTEAERQYTEEPLPFEPQEDPVALPADGTLLRMDGSPIVYLMQDGKRCRFRDAAAFTACGFGWNEIVVLPPKEIEPIPVGKDIAGAGDL